VLRRAAPRPGVELEQPLAGDRAVELPAVAAQNIVALAKSRIARACDLADDPAFDHRADFSRLGIGPDPADPAVHIRVEREIDPAHQHLALAGIGQRCVDYLEIGWCRRSAGPPLQQDLPVPVFHRLLLPCRAIAGRSLSPPTVQRQRPNASGKVFNPPWSIATTGCIARSSGPTANWPSWTRSGGAARIHAKEDAEKGPPLVGTTTITQEGIGTLRLANRRSPTQLNGDF